MYYGTVTEQISIVREDLLQRNLNLQCMEQGNNVYTFSWNETKGDYYELQQFDPEADRWSTVKRVELDGETVISIEYRMVV